MPGFAISVETSGFIESMALKLQAMRSGNECQPAILFVCLVFYLYFICNCIFLILKIVIDSQGYHCEASACLDNVMSYWFDCTNEKQDGLFLILDGIYGFLVCLASSALHPLS